MPKHVSNFRTNHYGYECWLHMIDYNQNYVAVHRLLAVAEHGFDAVGTDVDVHHKNGIPWDNRPSNIELIDKGKHAALHNEGHDPFEDKDTPYRDEEVLEELYVDRDMTVREVADVLDCSHPTVVRWLDRKGFETPDPGF